MKAKIHLLAFMGGESCREVSWDSGDFEAATKLGDGWIHEINDLLYQEGQNEFNKLDLPSASAGDVIEWISEDESTGSRFFTVDLIGFTEIQEEEFKVAMDSVSGDREEFNIHLDIGMDPFSALSTVEKIELSKIAAKLLSSDSDEVGTLISSVTSMSEEQLEGLERKLSKMWTKGDG